MSGTVHCSAILRRVWKAALDDAGISPDQAILFCFAGSNSRGGDYACAWPSDTDIDHEDEIVDFGTRLVLANSPAVRMKHRVAIWTSRKSEIAMAALLRHELEHSLQFAAHGQLIRRRFEVSQDILGEAAKGVPNNGFLRQNIPMEADANAAAAHFVRRHYGDKQVDAVQETNWPLLHTTERMPDASSVLALMDHFILCKAADLAERFKEAMAAGTDPKRFRLQ